MSEDELTKALEFLPGGGHDDECGFSYASEARLAADLLASPWGQRVQAQREACEFAAEYARVTEVRDKARAALGKEVGS